jgi:uncharacterized protein YqeY
LEDVKVALRARDKPRLGTLRLIAAGMKQREVDERITLDDEQVLSVLEKMVKQRRESIVQFERAERDDLVALESAELEVIRTYLPQPLDRESLVQLVDAALEKSGAESMRDMGRVMSALKPRIQGRADMGEVSALVKARLGS